jgi:hypothetical protein
MKRRARPMPRGFGDFEPIGPDILDEATRRIPRNVAAREAFTIGVPSPWAKFSHTSPSMVESRVTMGALLVTIQEYRGVAESMLDLVPFLKHKDNCLAPGGYPCRCGLAQAMEAFYHAAKRDK